MRTVTLKRHAAVLVTLFAVGLIVLLSVTLANMSVAGDIIVQETVPHTQPPARTKGRSNGARPPIAGSRKKTATPQRRVVHLDLKGAPPKLSYLESLFPLLRSAGATSLLVEYEDMFPYSGEVEQTSAENAYSPDQVRRLLELAGESDLEVIPLVQTFGHLEHALKGPKFAHLREEPDFPESICPSRNGTVELIKTMVDQVMALHAGRSTFLHIGCDEVFHLATCQSCTSRLRRINSKRKKDKGEAVTGRHLFLEHVKAVARYVRETHGVTPLVWDDMFRSISESDLVESGVGQLVEPVVWVYGEQIDAFVGGHVWHKYSAVFPKLWAASAFKGAFGERLLSPVIHRHYRNNLAWTEVMYREGRASGNGRPTDFRGLVLTGWSRYDHFAVLCELLPVSVPSLLLNLVAVSHPHSEADRNRMWSETMGCTGKGSDFMSLTSALKREDSAKFYSVVVSGDGGCSDFPGKKAAAAVLALAGLRADLARTELEVRGRAGWLTEYNVRHNFTSSWRMREPARELSRMGEVSAEVEAAARTALEEIYDKYTVSEWLEQNIAPVRKSLEESSRLMEGLMARKIWPRRPIRDL